MPVPYDTGSVTTNKTGQYVKVKAAPADYNLVHLLQTAGFKGQGLQTMYRVIMAESGGRANAFNGNAGTGDRSYGLAQINMLGQMGVNRAKQYGLSSYDQLFDPLTNLRAAYRISNGGTNFSPWTTYTSGRYLSHAFDPNYTVRNVGQGASGASGSFTPYSYASAGSGGSVPFGISGPPVPSLNNFLGTDVVYQNQLAASQKQLHAYVAAQQKQRAQLEAAYGLQEHNLDRQFDTDKTNTLNSYGARGIAHSSLLYDANNNLVRDYAQNRSGLAQQNTQSLADLQQQLRAYQDQQQNAQQAALAAAAARRAAMIGASAGAKLGASAIGVP